MTNGNKSDYVALQLDYATYDYGSDIPYDLDFYIYGFDFSSIPAEAKDIKVTYNGKINPTDSLVSFYFVGCAKMQNGAFQSWKSNPVSKLTSGNSAVTKTADCGTWTPEELAASNKERFRTEHSTDWLFT